MRTLLAAAVLAALALPAAAQTVNDQGSQFEKPAEATEVPSGAPQNDGGATVDGTTTEIVPATPGAADPPNSPAKEQSEINPGEANGVDANSGSQSVGGVAK